MTTLLGERCRREDWRGTTTNQVNGHKMGRRTWPLSGSDKSDSGGSKPTTFAPQVCSAVTCCGSGVVRLEEAGVGMAEYASVSFCVLVVKWDALVHEMEKFASEDILL